MMSPLRIVPGFEAAVGRLLGKLQYFSLPFISSIRIVIGSIFPNALAVALSRKVAENVAAPTLIRNVIVVSFVLGSFGRTGGSSGRKPSVSQAEIAVTNAEAIRIIKNRFMVYLFLSHC